MAVRVTDAEVKEILDTKVNTSPFIVAANLIVNQNLTDKGHSNELLKEIERWLAAHLVCIKDRRVRNESLPDGMQFSYESTKVGLGLEATSYGQQVLVFDSSGTLARMGAKSASFRVD